MVTIKVFMIQYMYSPFCQAHLQLSRHSYQNGISVDVWAYMHLFGHLYLRRCPDHNFYIYERILIYFGHNCFP